MVKQDHTNCIEHFKLEGYKKKLCVQTGQTRESVVEFALEILRKRDENTKSFGYLTR